MKNCESIIKLVNVKKNYRTKEKIIIALDSINLELKSGTFYAVMGHSGSGKSTLVNILGLIDEIDAGDYYLFGENVVCHSDNELSKLRMKNVGFIFQSFNLDLNLKAYENVILPMLINGDISISERKERAIELLNIVGLNERTNHYPKELSGGEQQRVAIARALANNPEIILADEPTGNLDEKNEKVIFEHLKKLSNSGKCVIVVTHSNEVKKYADEIFLIKNGIILE